MTEEQAALTNSLELCAETGVDIVPEVFEHFFAANASARELMEHSDAHMRGRMLEATMELFLSDDSLGPGNYLEWELGNHLDAYGATAPMYDSLFQSIVEVVRGLAGAQWTAAHEAAWRNRIGRIMDQVRRHPQH